MRSLPRIPLFAVGAAAALLLGWLVFPSFLYERIDQPLHFSHALHTSDSVGLSCSDCHGFDDEGRFAGIPVTRVCADCHEEMVTDSEFERRLVEDYVTADREIVWKIYARQPENVYFPHASHVVLAEIDCARCHGDHGASEALRPLERNRLSGYSRDIWGTSVSRFAASDSPRMKMGDCCACHRQSKVTTGCLDCHR
ncbi:MAG TPA: menaquinone reductase multiheme cytochrome c subunit QrcA [Candidatus Krumholzibacteria bacterium]|nr:menaquinone reductase multiheme cytochrome c subunit QrcA [Candidatus Krumholzibacteria bacterium]